MSSSQVVLITGANTGLGYQIVLALLNSSKQYTILLGGRNFAKAEAAVTSATKEIPSSSSKVAPIQIDIEDDESIQRAFDEVRKKYGKLDGLVNNAGTSLSQCHPDIQLLTQTNKSQAHNSTKKSPNPT